MTAGPGMTDNQGHARRRSARAGAVHQAVRELQREQGRDG